MQYVLVAIYDQAQETFANPIVVPTTAVAVRSFTNQVRNGNDDGIKQAPQDFELWMLGFYDPNTGTFDNKQERLARAVDLLER